MQLQFISDFSLHYYTDNNYIDKKYEKNISFLEISGFFVTRRNVQLSLLERTFNYQLLDEVEQNIVICHWRADQLFSDAEGRGK